MCRSLQLRTSSSADAVLLLMLLLFRECAHTARHHPPLRLLSAAARTPSETFVFENWFEKTKLNALWVKGELLLLLLKQSIAYAHVHSTLPRCMSTKRRREMIWKITLTMNVHRVMWVKITN